MPLVDIDLKPEARKLKQFGFVALFAFGLLGGVALWKNTIFGFDLGGAGEATGWALIGLGVLSAVFALVAPAANRPVYTALVLVTLPIGLILSFVLLGALFYLVITPFGLFFRLIGRDALNLKMDRSAETYWTRRDKKVDVARYFKQY